MNDLFISIVKTLENKNYYAAILISLTLPDICGKIQSPTKSFQQRFIDWFNQYLKDNYIGTLPKSIPFLTGEDLYSFRCSLLHEGSEDISNQSARRILSEFILTENGPHLNFFDYNGHSILQLNITDFCTEICAGVKKWVDDFKDSPEFIEYKSKFVKIYPSGTTLNGIKFG